jgi:catechol 2,3-dioxygenase-like lactoylglutathione lyase family enzyme
MVVDHVALLVPDAEEAVRELRERHGLGCEPGMYYPRAGTRHHLVPLLPPQMVELLTLEDREAAARSEPGRRVLACDARGFGLFSWCVLVDDLTAVADRVGGEIFDYTIPQPDGTLRGWRAVSGPEHLPFFIDYPNNGDRAGRIRAMYERVGHTSAPTRITELTISGSAAEHRAWLGEHDLPLGFVAGDRGIVEARIATARGDVVLG